jgi:hypothetical protein
MKYQLMKRSGSIVGRVKDEEEFIYSRQISMRGSLSILAVVPTESTVRITVYHFKTSCQNSVNESTSFKYLSGK